MHKTPKVPPSHEFVITNIDQITSEWLNSILDKQGLLKNDKIKNISIDHSGSTNAHIARLHIDYELETESLPKNLLLKMCKSENDFIKDSEVNYYSRDYVSLPNAPIPKCYDAQFSSGTAVYHILMEDLSKTHHKDAEPTKEYGEAVADALALLHSHGWGKKIESLGEHMLNESKIAQYVDYARPGLQPMVDVMGDRLDETSRQAIDTVFEQFPEVLLKRTKDRQGFTVVHGDPNPGNILYPNNGLDKTYLLDRQPFKWSLTTSLGVSDLSYMMVPFWETAQRQKLEMPILQRYYKQIQTYGIVDYGWEKLLDDYKLTAMQGFFIAADWCIKEDDRKNMEGLWTAELQRSLQTYFDLESENLFKFC
jgi:hypothetical protein